jgi:hypothetical protein
MVKSQIKNGTVVKRKKVLSISYSQSGQLYEIENSISAPLKNDGNIDMVAKKIELLEPYPFPWDFMTFMDTFPESVYLDPPQIKPFEDDDNEYDLVILYYQVWFLSPSLPMTAFLKSEYAKQKLKNKPVVTVIGCRNMWIMAQEKVKTMLSDIGANLVDNIVLVDQGSSLATFVTTPRWMMTGKKDSFLGLFPPAGVSQQDIIEAKRFGDAIATALRENDAVTAPTCKNLNAVNVDVRLINSEKIATKSFKIWGGWIRKLGKPGAKKRKPLVMAYVVFLLLIIVTIVPMNMIIQTIKRKVNKEAVLKQKRFYEQPSQGEITPNE